MGYMEFEDYFEEVWEDEEEENDRPGCLFPGNCHMPGLHHESECRSLDEVAEIYNEMERREFPV